LAAVRVLVFSAAFPFFNNVDERRHFDLVIKYAEGHVPRSAEMISPTTLPYLSHYASPEFLSGPRRLRGRLLRTDVEASSRRSRADDCKNRRDLGSHA
jgi:hypothetical protein